MLEFDEHKLSTPFGTSIQWDEVVAVHAHKIDAITHPVTMITLDHLCGEFVEFNTTEAGFDLLREKLATFLPLPENWFELVDNLELRTGITLMPYENGDTN